MALPSASHASPPATPACRSVEIEATLSAKGDRIYGTLRCELTDNGPVRVLAFPEFMNAPNDYDDVNVLWHFPDGRSDGGMQIFDATSNRAVLLHHGAADLTPVQPEVTLRFDTQIPARHGPLARHKGGLFLLGAWHPVLVRPGAQQRLPATHIAYTLQLPTSFVGVIGGRPHARNPAAGPTQRATGRILAPYLPLLMAPELQIAGVPHAAPRGPGNDMHIVSVPPETHSGLRDLSADRDQNAQRALQSALAAGAQFLRSVGIELPRLWIVRGHVGERLVIPFPGGMMIDERAFHLLPYERFMKFHKIRVWRTLFGQAITHLIQSRQQSENAEQEANTNSPVQGRDGAPPASLGLPTETIADAVATALLDRFVRAQYGGHESAPDVLEAYAIIPEIDALIFAPQVPFADAYYNAIDETPRARNDIDDFATSLPRGKLLHDKLVDRYGLAAVHAVTELFLTQGLDWEDALCAALGREASEVLRPWLGAYPKVDYSLGPVTSTPEQITVSVMEAGPDAGRAVDTITIEVEDADGETHRATRLGPGTLTVQAPGPPKLVELDPGHRLVEHHHVPGEGARYNNRSSPRWRFLLNNITGLLAVTQGELIASANFSLRRIHDLRLRFDFLALYSPSSLGAAATTTYGFGEELTPLRLSHRAGLAAAYERLRTEDDSVTGGRQSSLTAFYVFDDRLSPYASYRGKGVALRAVAASSTDDLGAERLFAQAGASAFHILPLALGHGLLGRVRVDAQLGDAPPQNGLRLGGRYRGARGFESDEARSDFRLLGSLEYRHVLEADARTDMMGLITWTRIDGAFFADTVFLPGARARTTSSSQAQGDPCERDVFYDVGYGLRFMGDILNISPGTIQIDLGVPIGRCLPASNGLPFTVYVAFLQSFISF